MKKVGIIGAGFAGVCAAKHCITSSALQPIVWEQTDKIGGTWAYSARTGTDEYGLPIHSSMYKNLRTNLPKEIMAFPDFPYPEGGPSYIHHTEVLKYVNRYAKHFDVFPHIKFRHHVEHIEPRKTSTSTSWVVTTRNLETNTTSETVCDAIFICNGHYSVPKMPDITDLDKFNGIQVHSHNYRENDMFKDLNVAILGAAASGMDISLEVAKVAKKVYLCHNHPCPLPSKLPNNLVQAKGITKAYNDGFELKDGSIIKADAILHCTGYHYSFPFLSDKCGISVVDNRVTPLYKHIINIEHPTMAFIGLQYLTLPSVMFDVQVRMMIGVLLNVVQLPSAQGMLEDADKDYKDFLKSGSPAKHYYMLWKRQWPYFDKIIADTKTKPLNENLSKMYAMVTERQILDLEGFKKYRYSIEEQPYKEYVNSTGELVHTNRELFILKFKAAIWLLFNAFPEFMSVLFSMVYFYLKRILNF